MAPGKRIVGFLLGIVLLAGCSGGALPSGGETGAGSQQGGAGPTQPPAVGSNQPGQAGTANPKAVERARILAVGDLLMHLPLVETARMGDGAFDFSHLFEPVRPWIEGANLAVANLETTLTGTEYPWSGYPSFNTPPEFARDVKAVGFDVITNGNNHALDYGRYGLEQTAVALDRYGIPHTGTARTEQERDRIVVVSVTPQIKMAILSYTYGTNGLALPHPFSVNLLDADRIRSDIRRARTTPGVDLVAVALHMGQEYARKPDDEQKDFVRISLEAGADIILGDHPHVIQPIEWRQVKDEFGRDLPRAIIYSLGNFISNQFGYLDREAGLMFLVDVKKEHGVTAVEQVSFVPTWVHQYWINGKRQFRVVSVEKAIQDYEAKSDPLITAADYQRLRAVWDDTTKQAVGSSQVQVYHTDKPVAVAQPPK